MEEEVELNIQLHVPNMQASTRAEMVITEAISTIVAIAFDENDALIKKVDAVLNKTTDTSGTLKIKVPKRTRTIHFLGNYTTNDITSVTTLDELKALTTNDVSTMHYWGKATFDGAAASLPVTLYRNMAKLTLTLGEGLTGYIAGFVNYNTNGTIVPSNDEVGNTPTIPTNVQMRSYEADNSLGNVYYLFEHANVKGSNPLYVIVEVLAKYYKIAFATRDAYFPIIRNHGYQINIEKIDDSYAETTYMDAVNSTYPINDLVITEVDLDVVSTPTEVLNESGQTSTVTVTIPEGVTELTVDAGDAFTVSPPDGLTTNSNGSYAVTTGEYIFTLKVKEDASSGNKTISFSGRGKYKRATGSTSIRLYQIENVTLPITPDAPTVGNTEGSITQLTVQIPDGITSLTITTDAFDVATPEGVTLENGTYNVSGKQGQSITFTLALKANGTAGDSKTVTFNGSGQYKRATGTATVTLQDNTLSNVNLTVAVIDEDANNPSMIYGQNSEEDLYVKVTIPTGVTALAFSSEYFDIASASDLKKEGDGGAVYLSGSGNSYTVNHQGEESITLPFRLRLKNNVSNTSASFTFTGSGETINNASATKNVTLQQRNPDDGSVYWEGYLPLNQADNTTKISIPKDKLNSAVNRVMRIECEKTQDNQALALLNNWNQFNPDMQYSTATIDVPLTQDFVNSITDNLIITGRGAEGMLMKKVSFLQLQTVQITAALTPQITSLNYTTNENSVSELIVNVTIPAGVTTLNFSSDYFDVEFINSTSLTDNGNGSYTVTGNAQISTDARLRLKNKTATQNAGFTFSGTGEGVMVTPATINNIALQKNGDENVRWQGDVELSYDYDARKIVLPYSWFSSVPVDSKLRVEYDIISTDGPLIQFSEVKDTWDDPGFHFPELDVTTDDRTIGCNLSDRKSNGGYWIYGTNESAFTGSASFDLTLSQDVLTALAENRRPDLFGGEDIVIAIQGKNVRLKKISVIPNNNASSTETVLYNNSFQFNTQGNGNWSSLSFDQEFRVGARITIKFTTGGTIKLCDINSRMLYVPEFAQTPGYPGANGNENYDLYMSVGVGDLVLNVVDGIELREWKTGNLISTISSSNPLNGLRIESGDAALERVTVTYPQ